MKLKAIHDAVEKKLGGVVSFNSVQDYIVTHRNGENAVIERASYGHYRLRVPGA